MEEEHALVLQGEVTLLLGDERYYPMKAGDYACFPAGQEVGHSFLNSGTGPCSWLMIGERNPNDVCVQPDSSKMEVRALRSEQQEMRADIKSLLAARHYARGAWGALVAIAAAVSGLVTLTIEYLRR